MPTILRDDALLAKWQEQAFSSLQRLDEAINLNKASEAKSWAITAGIAADKTLVLGGRPTSISASIHEVRHQMPELAKKLAALAERAQPRPLRAAQVIIDATARKV